MNEETKKQDPEPTFTLRASDPYAPMALRVYAQFRENANEGMRESAAARDASQKMVDWAVREDARVRDERIKAEVAKLAQAQTRDQAQPPPSAADKAAAILRRKT